MTRRRFSVSAILAVIGNFYWPSPGEAAAAMRSDDRIVVHQNWVLKLSDLDR